MGFESIDANFTSFLTVPQVISVYLDDVIIFSETLKDHLEHLKLVMERLRQAGLKLKP